MMLAWEGLSYLPTPNRTFLFKCARWSIMRSSLCRASAARESRSRSGDGAPETTEYQGGRVARTPQGWRSAVCSLWLLPFGAGSVTLCELCRQIRKPSVPSPRGDAAICRGTGTTLR
jgi:hypothetical protein